MGTFLVCLSAVGAAAAVIGTVHSVGWLILGGGFALLIGALAVASTPAPR